MTTVAVTSSNGRRVFSWEVVLCPLVDRTLLWIPLGCLKSGRRQCGMHFVTAVEIYFLALLPAHEFPNYARHEHDHRAQSIMSRVRPRSQEWLVIQI